MMKILNIPPKARLASGGKFQSFSKLRIYPEQSRTGQISNWERGFTLVELLAVAIVVLTVGALISLVLTFSLRGTNKANTINDVRQNGNYAILQMSKMIEYAKSFDGVSSNGLNYNYNCVLVLPPSPTPSPSPVQYSFVRVSNFDGVQTVFSCLSDTVASNGASLIDTNAVSLDTNSCFFTCSAQKITDVPMIGINFSLSKKTNSGFAENKTSIPFKTSVTMRNLGK